MNSFALQHFGGAYALPCRCDLDQHALTANAIRVVLLDDAARLRDGGVRVIRKARVHFRRDAAGNDSQNFLAESDGQPLKCEVGHSRVGCTRTKFLPRGQQHAVHNRLILRQLRRCGNQRRVGGRVLRAKLSDCLNVAGVGDDHSVLAQLVKNVPGQILRHDSSWGKALQAASAFDSSLPLFRFAAAVKVSRGTDPGHRDEFSCSCKEGNYLQSPFSEISNRLSVRPANVREMCERPCISRSKSLQNRLFQWSNLTMWENLRAKSFQQVLI